MGSQGVDYLLECEKCGEQCILNFRNHTEFKNYRHKLHCWGPGDEDECGGLLHMIAVLTDDKTPPPSRPTRKQILDRING